MPAGSSDNRSPSESRFDLTHDPEKERARACCLVVAFWCLLLIGALTYAVIELA